MKEHLEDAITEIGGELIISLGRDNKQPDGQAASGRDQSPSRSEGTHAEE
jgi:hypothetical protein